MIMKSRGKRWNAQNGAQLKRSRRRRERLLTDPELVAMRATINAQNRTRSFRTRHRRAEPVRIDLDLTDFDFDED